MHNPARDPALGRGRIWMIVETQPLANDHTAMQLNRVRRPSRWPALPSFYAMPFGIAGLAAVCDVRAPVLAPFLSLAPITGMLLEAAPAPYEDGVGKALAQATTVI